MKKYNLSIIREFQKCRRESIADEKRQAKAGFYKCAIQSHQQAATLLCVINRLKSETPRPKTNSRKVKK